MKDVQEIEAQLQETTLNIILSTNRMIRDMRKTVSAEATTSVTKIYGHNICGHCGHKSMVRAKYCTQCGRKFK